MKKLFALFIAIDKYAIPAHNLNGAVNDMEAVQQFLKRYAAAQNLEFSPKVFTNEKATRKNIVKGFDHFDKANDEDCCFFYYSGHGSQAIAPTEFWTNPNGMNESIVCHDSRIPGGRDLMDKELGYLIWEATKGKDVHFLAMMDCCHSGSATRSMEGETARKVAPNFTPQTVEDYLGFKHYPKEDGQYSAPPSNHILLGACRDNELAKETSFNGTSRGVFTFSLLETLEDGGIHQSYQELMQRTRIKAEQRAVQQHPQLEGKHGAQGFLGLAEVKGMPNVVYFDTKKNEWRVDAGGLQGLREDADLKLNLTDGKEVEITKVMTNESKVSGMEDMDKNKQYEAWMSPNGMPALSLFMSKEVAKKCGGKVKDSLSEFSKTLKISWKIKEKDAQYAVKMYKECLILTKSGDDVPVFKRVETGDIDHFSKAVSEVAYWEKVLAVNNPKTKISRNEIELKFTVFDNPLKTEKGDAKKETVNPTDAINLKVDEVTDEDGLKEERGQTWQLEVTNNSKTRDFWINGVYLDSAFGVNSIDFNTNIRLEKGQSQVLSYEDDGQRISKVEGWLDDAYLTWGVNEITDYFKIFVSTKEMNRVYPQQEPLPLDVKGEDPKGTRGAKRPKQYTGDDWAVFDVVFKVKRPFQEVSLAAGGSRSLQGIKITAPAGFSGKASLTNLKEVTRNLSNTKMPPFFWKTDEQSIAPLTRGVQQSDGLEVLEIFDTENKDKVTPENPVILNFEDMEMGDDVMIPWGLDEKTGLYYPLGGMDEDGNVVIQTLPDETSSENTRSLGGSIKIFFQKVTKIFYKHPLLQQVEVTSRDDMEYLKKDLAAIKQTIEKGEPKKVAVFIHGIIGDTKEMAKTVKRVKLPNGQELNEYYDVVLTFDYENLSTSIKQTAADFKERLTAAGLGENHGHTLHIYAHSMGGLVSRWMIEQMGGDKMVTHLFQFGTPNGGSEWSDVQEMATVLLTNAVNGAAFLQPYLLPLSIAARYLKKVTLTLGEMNPESDFMKDLNNGTIAPIPYSIVNGNTQLIKGANTAKQVSLLKKVIARFKSRGHYDALDLLLFKQANDICVSIPSQSTFNEGTEFIKKVVGCDHISYFVNPVSLKALEEVLAEREETVFN